MADGASIASGRTHRPWKGYPPARQRWHRQVDDIAQCQWRASNFFMQRLSRHLFRLSRLRARQRDCVRFGYVAALFDYAYCGRDAFNQIGARFGQLLLHFALFGIKRGAGGFAHVIPFRIRQPGQVRWRTNAHRYSDGGARGKSVILPSMVAISLSIALKLVRCHARMVSG